MCRCTPSLRTPNCGAINCYPGEREDIHASCSRQIIQLEDQVRSLMKLLGDTAHILTAPPPMIFCKDCPNINRDVLDGITKSGY